MSTTILPPDDIAKEIKVGFQELNEILQDIGALLSAAETHGLIIGQMCSQSERELAGWIMDIYEMVDATEPLQEKDELVLRSVIYAAEEDLQSDELAFELMLPDAEDDPSVQLEQLVCWCQGFIAGFGLNTSDEMLKGMSDDAKEIVDDLLDISKSDFEMSDEESDETALFEISEYLRMGVLLLFTECAVSQRKKGAGSNDQIDNSDEEPPISIH